MYAHSLVKAKSNYLDPAWAQNLLKRPRYYDFEGSRLVDPSLLC